jgi:hypothetical protein
MYRKSKNQHFKSVSILRIQAFVNIAHSYCLGPLREDMALYVVLDFCVLPRVGDSSNAPQSVTPPLPPLKQAVGS